MKNWESWLGRKDSPAGEARFGFQDWVDLFQFGGTNYPILNTTWGNQLTEEAVIQTGTAAYKQSGPVFALIVARLQVFSQIRFQWTNYIKGHPGDLYGNPDLGVLERPWRSGVTADLLARMEIDVSTAGNSYTRRLRRGVGPTKVDRLQRLHPEWVTIILGSEEEADHPSEAGDVEVAGYVYHPGGRGRGKAGIVLLPEEVAHYAPLPDPDRNFLGQSWISPVIREIQADDASEVHKRKFFENAATPNLAIKFDPALQIGDVREFKALMEEEHKGAWNAYKTLFLGGGADPVVIGKDFQQLQFAATQGKGESRLASAAGVPPSWVGFSEGLQGSALNAGNFGAARRRYGDGTMRHLWGNACASLESILTVPGGANLWYSDAAVPFLREDSKDLAEIKFQESQTITALVREGFTAESAIKAVQEADWSLLKHTGYVSVQLQIPGQENTAPVAPPQEGQGS